MTLLPWISSASKFYACHHANLFEAHDPRAPDVNWHTVNVRLLKHLSPLKVILDLELNS